MNPISLRRTLASALVVTLVASCPGLAPYAAAQAVRASASAAANGAAPAIAPVMGLTGASSYNPSLVPTALGLTPSLAAASAPAPVLSVIAPVASKAATEAYAEGVSLPHAVGKGPAHIVPATLTPTAGALAAASKDIASTLEGVGPIKNASAGSAATAGRDLEAVLTGLSALKPAESLGAPSVSDNGAFEGSMQLARPAGDSIRESAAANSDDGGVPTPPPSSNGPSSDGPANKGPFWPRLLSAGLALAPAILLAPALLAASAYLVGGLVVASSLSLAIMPFLGEGSPKVLRAAPGLILAGLGVASAGVALSLTLGLGVAVAPSLIWTGALALVGGWGLTRYGLGKSEGRYGSYGSVETLSAFFGGLAALTGVALAASTPLGWLATATLWVAMPVSAALWFHLPGWVGKGVSNVFEGLWLGVKGESRVLTSIHRDTVLLDRLQNFSKRHWNASKWNGVWLAVMWTPIMLAEAVMYVLSAVAGLYVGAISAPVNFLWGAAHKLWPGSKLDVYFAEAARLVFDNVQNGKVTRYNPLAAKLIPVANSPKFLVSATGSAGLRLLQLGWLLYTAVATPLLAVGGLLVGFGRANKGYDEKRHSPSYLKVTRDDSPSEKPTEPSEPSEPGTPAKAPLAPKLIAVALALVPAWFFGLPILAGHSIIQIGLYFALVLPLAAMPFMGPNTPKFLKTLAGKAMFYNGLVFLLNGNAILVGLIALLGGWGFQQWVKKTQEKGGSFDEAELGAFFGALGSAAAIGAVWAGFTTGLLGWGTLGLAAVTSIFLIMHLPAWVWRGWRGVFKSIGTSIRSYQDVARFWAEDTDFRSNMKSQANWWLKKTYWNGVWLSVIWVPTGLVEAVEFVVSLALGLAAGLLRAPFAFAASALKDAKPYTKKAIFADELVKGWAGSAEGSKSVFDKLVAGLKPAMNEKTSETGRPTAKAAGAFLVARLAQLAWLAGVLAMTVSGLSFLVGLVKGAKAAFAPAKDYQANIPLWLDGPVGDSTMTEKGLPALKSFLESLTGEFDRAKIAYDKDAFDVEKITNRGLYTSQDGKTTEVFIHLTLNASQAAVARGYARLN